MEYIQSLEGQIILFLRTCGFGFILGILYEVFRVIRIILEKPKIVFFTDVLYMLLSAVLFFIFLLTFGNGGLRINILVALLIGWLTYIYALGRKIESFTVKFIVGTKRCIVRLLRVLTAPFRAVFRFIQKPIDRIKHLITKKSKKVSKMLKIHLKFRT